MDLNSLSAYIQINDVSVSYPTRGRSKKRLEVLTKINLSVGQNEFICIFGPNGCGKTTILNLIAGLVNPESGTVLIDGKPPGSIKVSCIFQNFEETLLPWRTCFDNLTFPLEVNGNPRKKARELVIEYLKTIHDEFPLTRYPYQLSGGQKQLLAIHRALVFQPNLFLLDEPFNSLDYDMRTAMEDRLLSIWGKNKIPTMFVSHEIDEAIYLSDRVIVLSQLPAKVIADIPVNLERPRKQNLVRSETFARVKSYVLEAFYQGYKR